MEKLKPSYYDRFSCIADRCTYSCCTGWTIHIDKAAYEKYKALEKPEIISHLIPTENGGALVQMQCDGNCAFLDDKGLCELVKEYGESYLSNTCDRFPRAAFVRDGVLEQFMSNGCPEILRFLQEEQKLSFVMEPENGDYIMGDAENTGWTGYRNYLIDLMQLEDMDIGYKLYIGYMFCKELFENRQEREIIYHKFQTEEYLLSLYKTLLETKPDLFVKQNLLAFCYKKANEACGLPHGFRMFLKGQNARLLERSLFAEKWTEFECYLRQQEQFIENYIVNAIFGKSLYDETGEFFYYAFIALIVQLALCKYSLFLLWIENHGSIGQKEVTHIFCYYARMIDHNPRKMYELIIDLIYSHVLDKDGVWLLCR